MSVSPALAASTCPINYGAHSGVKTNKLYLLFPANQVNDPLLFPEHGFNPETKWLPLPLKTSDLRHYTGSFDELKNAVHDVVTDIYCEFNVQVIAITDPMPMSAVTSRERRNTIGIGSDELAHGDCTAGQAGTAGGDPGDSHPQDFARIWAGSFNCEHFVLDNEGWANSIGSSAAHEAGHNYGVSHADGDVPARPDEDGWSHHLMKPGFAYSAEHRAKRRHFSDLETSVLARHVGLAMDTMWTLDLTNPNDGAAAKLRIELLSVQPEIILSWTFAEPTSPWIDPTLSGPLGKRTLKGTQYTVYTLEWAIGQPWSDVPGGNARPSGRVPRGAHFQVGATFSSASPSPDPNAIIISDVKLIDESDKPLANRPHWMGFDTGTFETDTGNLNVRFFNFLDRPLILRDVVIRDLPRVMSVKAMMRESINGTVQDKPIVDIFDRAFTPWDKWGTRRPVLRDGIGGLLKRESTPWSTSEPQRPSLQYTIQPGEEFALPVANLSQGRHISIQRNDSECAGQGKYDLACHGGITLDDLFPATTMYIRATVIDPATAGFGMPAVESQLFYQIAGRRARLP